MQKLQSESTLQLPPPFECCTWGSQCCLPQVCLLASDIRSRHAAAAAAAAASPGSLSAAAAFEWALPATAAVQYDKLRGELYLGGAYVRLFLRNPKHPLRNPAKFAEGILERYVPTGALSCIVPPAVTTNGHCATLVTRLLTCPAGFFAGPYAFCRTGRGAMP